MKAMIDRYRFRYIPSEFELPREVKVRVQARAWYRWRQNNANFAIYLAWVAVLAAWFIGSPLLDRFAPRGPLLSLLPLFSYAFAFVVGFEGHALMQRYRFAPCVWAELHARGYPICACGYPRASLPPGAACPECGTSARAVRAG